MGETAFFPRMPQPAAVCFAGPLPTASLVPANNLGTCSSARVASVADLSQIYGAFKLLDISFSQPSSLGSAGLWETEKRVVAQAHCR